MKTGAAGFLGLMVASAFAGDVSISRKESQEVLRGAAQNFSGRVTISSSFQAQPPGRVRGALVTFEAGARTAWHTHPLGQTLIVTAGIGWVQTDGHARQEIREGDVVSIPANTRHWHGASTRSGMSHLAITEALDGSVVNWLEQVSNADYLVE